MKYSHSITLSLLVVFSFTLSNVLSLSCLTKAGPVDWWVVKKMPRGFNYFVVTPQNNERENDINDKNSPLSLTMSQLDPKTMRYYVWNDQPTKDSAVRGGAHSKGILMTDEKTTVYISHSVPKYPYLVWGGANKDDRNEAIWENGVPESGQNNGQHFACFTMAAAAFDMIKDMLRIETPSITVSSPISKGSDAPKNWEKDGDRLAFGPLENAGDFPCSQYQEFTTQGKTPLYLYSKWGRGTSGQPNFQVDSWTQIASHMNVKLLVSTHFSGKPMRKTFRSNDLVRNIWAQVGFNGRGDAVVYGASVDHSKFGISEDPKAFLVCFGDSNRHTTQTMRGGMIICIKHEYLYKEMSKTIAIWRDVGEVEKEVNLPQNAARWPSDWDTFIKRIPTADKEKLLTPKKDDTSLKCSDSHYLKNSQWVRGVYPPDSEWVCGLSRTTTGKGKGHLTLKGTVHIVGFCQTTKTVVERLPADADADLDFGEYNPLDRSPSIFFVTLATFKKYFRAKDNHFKDNRKSHLCVECITSYREDEDIKLPDRPYGDLFISKVEEIKKVKALKTKQLFGELLSFEFTKDDQ